MHEKKLEVYLFFILLGVALYLSFQIFFPYLYTIIIAIIFAVIFSPMHKRIKRSLPRHEGLSAALAVCGIIILLLVPLVFYGIELSDEVKNIYDQAFYEVEGKGLIDRVTDASNNMLMSFSPFGVNWPVFDANDTKEYALNFLSWVRGHFGDIFSGLAKFFVNLFLFLLALFYFLKDGDKLRGIIVHLSPFSDDKDEAILSKLKLAIVSVMKGSIFVALIQGILTGLGFFIFGVPSAVLWAGVATVAALIPAVGTSLVILPAVLFLAFTGATGSAIGLLIWGIIAVGLVDNILGPKFVESGIKIHPFLILLSALGGISFFGAIGFILGPITLSFLFALLDIYKTILVKDIEHPL